MPPNYQIEQRDLLQNTKYYRQFKKQTLSSWRDKSKRNYSISLNTENRVKGLP